MKSGIKKIIIKTDNVNGYYSQFFLDKKITSLTEKDLVLDSSNLLLFKKPSATTYPFSPKKREMYETIVLIDLLNLIPDFKQLLKDSKRSLKKGGRLLITCSSMALPLGDLPRSWGFTARSLEYLLEQDFGKNWTVENFGNVLTGRYFIKNKKVTSLTKEELLKKDEHFVVVTGVEAFKK